MKCECQEFLHGLGCQYPESLYERTALLDAGIRQHDGLSFFTHIETVARLGTVI